MKEMLTSNNSSLKKGDQQDKEETLERRTEVAHLQLDNINERIK